uniref:Reverse transcriptase domain-containing protein n=1 Tax=Tanacetum cinerariifolium TaxID=118510 RepID=A0A6L2N951_TANCI|nr:reverse transcriptase domain-containing protein [Tanacetum cinerariifolium]
MPNNLKTYDGTGDPKDRLKIFQAAAQVECWAMPTWCHMFNSTLIGAARVWFDELSSESIYGYKGLKAAFLAYFLQQKKYVKDPVEIHNIKQRDGETIEEFMKCFKIETRRMKGASECMRISGFLHGVNNPELTKRLNEHVPKTLEEMRTATTAFIRVKTVVAAKKKVHTPWKSQDQSKRMPKVIFAAESGKFKPPLPMVTLVEKRSSNKFCEFHNDKGHSTDECVHLRKKIEELPSDMTRVPRSIAENRLDIREGYSPVRQKKRGQALERAKAIQVEVQKMVKAGILPEVYYHDWLSNPVMVKKHDDKAFDRQIGRKLEIYLDDLVIKSQTKTKLLRDIEEMFRTLRKINMKLNPKKCTFGVAEGMFLGYMINPKGIKPCPDKTEAVLQLPSPRTIKERCIKKSNFRWTPEAKQAFKQLKQHLAKLPMLVVPKPKEELIMYLSASYGVISAVLMTEGDTIQTLVYFVSRALQAPELNYTAMEKLVLVLVAAKRLCRYFQAHPIMVITDQPIMQVISRPDVAGRLQKWSVMLGEHNITYRQRTSVKGQILADFLV